MTTLASTASAETITLGGLGHISEQVLGHRSGLGASRWLNGSGGDVCGGGAGRSLTRHSANYAMSLEVARNDELPPGPVIDVGCGVGTHSAWLAEALDRPLWLVEPDPAARHAAAETNPSASVFRSICDAPAGAGALVTAMEVIEHLPFADQQAFIDDMLRITAPGGLICLSTPDESRYVGGRSNYAPHIGALGWCAIEELFDGRAGRTAMWRLHGGPFSMGRMERLVVPALNGAYAEVSRRAPTLVKSAAPIVVRALRHRSQGRQRDVEVTAVWATRSPEGAGTGLFVEHRSP